MTTATRQGGDTEKVIFEFELGEVITTAGALRALGSAEAAGPFLARHRGNDWGDCGQFDAGENDEAVQAGGRIVSIYHTEAGKKLYIITEAARNATTIMLASEY